MNFQSYFDIRQQVTFTVDNDSKQGAVISVTFIGSAVLYSIIEWSTGIVHKDIDQGSITQV